MRSSYRLRSGTKRNSWADGTELAPWQAGPDISSFAPAGTFVEDYEYVPGSGDLDESNARFAATPEYPEGTWAYFLATDESGSLAYPYAVGPVFRGQVEMEPEAQQGPVAGLPYRLFFDPRLHSGARPMYLEKMHEQVLHVLIASEDLSQFAHIHPARAAGGGYAVEHVFPTAGRYHIYLDYALPGEGAVVRHETVIVEGDPAAAVPLKPQGSPVAGVIVEQNGIRFRLATEATPVAGKDLDFTLDLTDAATGQPIADLQPYLGAWAHFVILSADGEELIHAHPVDGKATSQPDESAPHDHMAVAGPSPAVILSTAGFRRGGLYKLWAQVRRAGLVITVPFVLEVASAPEGSSASVLHVPEGYTLVRIGSSGYTPGIVTVQEGAPVRLAFLREDAANCGAVLKIPSFGITRTLKVGRPELVEFTAPAPGTFAVTCGMGMLRGAVIVKSLDELLDP